MRNRDPYLYDDVNQKYQNFGETKRNCNLRKEQMKMLSSIIEKEKGKIKA